MNEITEKELTQFAERMQIEGTHAMGINNLILMSTAIYAVGIYWAAKYPEETNPENELPNFANVAANFQSQMYEEIIKDGDGSIMHCNMMFKILENITIEKKDTTFTILNKAFSKLGEIASEIFKEKK